MPVSTLLYRYIFLSIATLSLFSICPSHQQAHSTSATKTCSLKQTCHRPHGIPDAFPCPDPNKVNNPVIEDFEPQHLDNLHRRMLADTCPHLDPSAAHCCLND